MAAPIHSVLEGGEGGRGSKEMELWIAMSTPLGEIPVESERRIVNDGSLKFLRGDRRVSESKRIFAFDSRARSSSSTLCKTALQILRARIFKLELDCAMRICARIGFE